MMLLRLLLVLILIYVLYRLLWKKPVRRSTSDISAKNNNAEEMKKDPVCGTFLPQSQALTSQYRGETYHFCSEDCRQEFLQRHAD